MKVFLSIALSFLILLQPLSKMFLVMEYQVNKNYIARVFCENKDKPQLACNGQCHLAKELKQAEKAEQKQSQPIKDKLEVVYFIQHAARFSFTKIIASIQHQTVYLPSRQLNAGSGIFQPPRFSV